MLEEIFTYENVYRRIDQTVQDHRFFKYSITFSMVIGVYYKFIKIIMNNDFFINLFKLNQIFTMTNLIVKKIDYKVRIRKIMQKQT